MTENYSAIPVSVTTPDEFETRLGPIQFRDGYATPETAASVADGLDFLHGVEAFMNSIQGVSLWAIRKGFADVGVSDNEFVIFSEMMDASSLFLTANADTCLLYTSDAADDTQFV
mgnify:CR=1 FL=1